MMARECHDTYGRERQFRFSVEKMEELPFSESCFDVVLGLGVFEYIVDSHVAMEESPVSSNRTGY
jgi:ubiquinone/menaquinone biosynthesis C-methylase UbiE